MADPDLIRALSDLTLAVRGGLQMTTRSGDRSSDQFVAFQGAIGNGGGGGSTTAVVWTPSAGTRYVLKGFAITAIVRTTLAATSNHALYFYDSSGTSIVVAPIASYVATQVAAAAAATDLSPILTGANGPLQVDLCEGVKGSAINTTLNITTGNDIGTGIIRYTGVLWGSEEPK